MSIVRDSAANFFGCCHPRFASLLIEKALDEAMWRACSQMGTSSCRGTTIQRLQPHLLNACTCTSALQHVPHRERPIRTVPVMSYLNMHECTARDACACGVFTAADAACVNPVPLAQVGREATDRAGGSGKHAILPAHALAIPSHPAGTAGCDTISSFGNSSSLLYHSVADRRRYYVEPVSSSHCCSCSGSCSTGRHPVVLRD